MDVVASSRAARFHNKRDCTSQINCDWQNVPVFIAHFQYSSSADTLSYFPSLELHSAEGSVAGSTDFALTTTRRGSNKHRATGNQLRNAC